MTKSTEKKNAKQFPKVFYAKHMETGLAKYDDETILIDGDNLKNMIPSFVGKPVYIQHQDVDLGNLKEESAGYVTDSFYNELDGWLWVKFLAIEDEVYEAIGNGWSVSNAYIPSEWGGAGVHHNCPYDRKIINGEFTHLAIVPNPRYEEAKIYTPEEYKIYQSQKKQKLVELQNSKDETKKGGIIMKFFKTEKKEVKDVDMETSVELKNDKGEVTTATIAEMVKALENAKKNEAEEKENEMDMEIEVGDEKMPLKELINRYTGLMNKCNESDEDKEKENESEEDKEKENEDGEEDKKEEKKNSKHFDELRNAHKMENSVHTIDLGMDQLARGKARYGSN